MLPGRLDKTYTEEAVRQFEDENTEESDFYTFRCTFSKSNVVILTVIFWTVVGFLASLPMILLKPEYKDSVKAPYISVLLSLFIHLLVIKKF